MSGSTLNSTFDRIERINAAATPDELIAALAEVAAAFGFDATAIAAFPRPDIPFDKRVLAHHWPNGWFEHYMARNYVEDDPVFRHSKTSLRPFQWSEARYERKSRSAKVMNEASDFGFAVGFCVPTITPHGPFNVTFGGRHGELSREDSGLLHLVAVYAQIRATELLSEGFRSANFAPLLSPREREVLRWSADGKTTAEIAERLGISEHTVLTHVANACRKLEAPNRVAAVARAISLRLIPLAP